MSRLSLLTSFALALVAMAGCKEAGPEIKRWQVPRVEGKIDRKVAPAAAVGDNDRMLAALVTEKDKAWSFRLLGPKAAVGALEPKFDEFLKSVKFGDDPPLSWSLPKGWKQTPGNQFRFATLKTGEPEDLEVTIVALPKEGGEILPNVNRWLGQLGQPPVTEKDLAKVTRDIEVHGRKGTLVDIVGEAGAKGKMPPMMGKAPPQPPRREPAGSLKYDIPKGWEKVAPKNAIISDQFAAVDGKDNVEITIVTLPGGAGGELANIERWRDQVKLPKVADVDELLKDFTRLDTGIGKAGMVDLNNPKIEGNNRIIGMIIPTESSTYFLKMMGPSELVGRNKPNFEAFAKSLRLEAK